MRDVLITTVFEYGYKSLSEDALFNLIVRSSINSNVSDIDKHCAIRSAYIYACIDIGYIKDRWKDYVDHTNTMTCRYATRSGYAMASVSVNGSSHRLYLI